MEAIANWSVVSYPWDADSENDGNTDFVELQNGSDTIAMERQANPSPRLHGHCELAAPGSCWMERPRRVT